MSRFRLFAVIPLLTSLISFVLTLIILFAGSKKGVLEDFSLLTLNVSTVGQNIIEFKPVNTTSTTTTTATTTASDSGTASTSSDPFSGFFSFFNLTDPFTSIGDGITATIDNLTSTVDSALQDAVNDIGTNLVQNLGLKQWYSFYLLSACDGNYTPSATADNAKKKTEVCKSYADVFNLNKFGSANTSVVLGTMEISVPSLEALITVAKDVQSQLTILLTVILVLCIISIISSGMVVLFSPFLFFCPTKPLPHKKAGKIVFYPALIFSQSASTMHLTSALFMTIATAVVEAELRAVTPLGFEMTIGKKFLALTWSAFVMAFLSSSYLGTVYWKEFRTWKFARRELDSEYEEEEEKKKESKRKVKSSIQVEEEQTERKKKRRSSIPVDEQSSAG